MGVKSLQSLVERLINSGLDPNTPSASIEWGTTQEQRVIEADIVDLPQLAQEADLQSPAITIIGDVVRLRAEGVQWFDILPSEILQKLGA